MQDAENSMIEFIDHTPVKQKTLTQKRHRIEQNSDKVSVVSKDHLD